MTAETIIDSLALRWPDAEYLSVREAPEFSDRGGRKIDLLVLSLWRSRGLGIDAIEIKASLSDWKRELQNAHKADFWWRHSQRFWVAVPAGIAEKVKEDLPEGWGLLACTESKAPKVVSKPAVRAAEPLPWSSCVGVMRAAAACGINALQRAERKGREEGVRIGQERAVRPDFQARQLEELRNQVKEFEEAAGVKISDSWTAGRIVAAVGIVLKELKDPDWITRQIGSEAGQILTQIDTLKRDVERLQKSSERISSAFRSEERRTA